MGLRCIGTWALCAALGAGWWACSNAATDTAAGGRGGAGTGAGGESTDAGLGGAGGADAGPDALDLKCTPTVTMQIEDTGATGQVFTNAVPDPEPFVQETGRTVCRILYRNPEEVRDANHITLIIRYDTQYPGWKSGDVGDITVLISTYFLAQVQADGRDVATEVKGVLLHEMTHMYQNDDKASGEGSYANLGNVIEGIGDFVRIRAGYPPNGAMPSKTGQWDDQGYWKPAYFLLWIDDQNPEFLYHLNLSMLAGDGVAWSPDSIQTLTGKSVTTWWAEYKTAICCAGFTTTCCS